MADIKQIKADELTLDQHNANLGTERGRYALEASLRQYGAGRSILVDRHGRVIAGNKTLETAADVGLDDVLVVQTDGKQIVAVQRMDLDLAQDADARMLAYADNRVAELDLSFDPEAIAADLAAGLPLDTFWQDYELFNLVNHESPDDPMDHWTGMPEFIQEDKTSYQSIHVHFKNAEEVQEFSKMIGQSLTDKTNSIWFSEREQMDFRSDRYTS